MIENQLLRYSRNIKLSEIGEMGQERLLNSKVLVVGAGGLGSPILLYLAAAGVGTIGIIDSDKVELSNLQRQIIHENADIGRSKVESARDAILDLNPDIKINCYNERLDEGNISKIINTYDIVADGSDNFETRFLINKNCYSLKKTLVSAAIFQFEGQISTFKPYLGSSYPCYRCIYNDAPPSEAIKCSETGVLGSIAGIMGAWQSAEVVKEILGIGDSLSGSLVLFDALSGNSRKVKVKPDPECSVCSAKAKKSD